MKKNVLEWLETTVESMADKVAYTEENGDSYTFSQVIDKAMRIGCALKGVSDNTPIAVVSGRHIHTITAFLGVVYSGHAYAPIDGKLPQGRLEAIFSLLSPHVVLTDSENFDRISELIDSMGKDDIQLVSYEEAVKAEIDDALLNEVREKMVSTDPLYVIFTSGSSGKPKGVMTSHQSLMYYIDSYNKVMNISKEDILGNQSPLDYIAAIRDIYLPLLTGCTSVIIPTEYFMQPGNLFDFMNERKITAVGWSVSALTIVSNLRGFEYSKPEYLKKVCFSGSVMPGSCISEWQKNCPGTKFVNQYGPTEATASCTYYEIDHQVEEGEVLPIGKEYTHYRVVLCNEDMTYTPKGEIGQICVMGPILALGYYNDSLRTSQSFINNPNNTSFDERMYLTGDYGRIREDGLLEFHGRMDRQIKHMGHRVELDEIDSVVLKSDLVDECISLYDPIKEKICLFYSGSVQKKDVILMIREELPDYMVPRKCIMLERLPKLPNGKTDMSTLKEMM